MKRISILMLLFATSMLMFTACKNEKAEDKSTGESEKVEETGQSASAGSIDPSSLAGDTYTINTDQASVNWFATKVGGKHNGTVNIKDGFLKMEDGNIVGGAFTFDMGSITVLDLDGEWKMKLENHLKGSEEGKEDHFFNVAQYPTANFVITKVSALEGSETANKMVYGDLTIKGITNPVGMTAMVSGSGENVDVKVSELVIDRTKWNVNYNSKKIFADLQDNIIHDDVKFQIGFAAQKS